MHQADADSHGKDKNSPALEAAHEAARESAEWVRGKDAGRLERLKAEKERQGHRKRRRIFIQGALLGVLVLIVLFQISEVAAVFKPEKPLRSGFTATDHMGDRCVTNLWKFSAALQKGEPPPRLVCPESGKSYLLLRADRDVVAQCPIPGQHHVSAMKVSLRRPIPEVVK